jgi:hypothetical protein
MDKKGIVNLNYDELGKTSEAIEEGRASLNRLSLEEEQGRTKGGRRNVEASVVLGRWKRELGENTQECSGSQKTQNENDARKKQEQLLEEWAKKKGIFEKYEDAISKRVLYDNTGTESKIYEGNDLGTIIKITFPYQFSNTLLEFLDNRISLHNYLFPETAYKLIGITKTQRGDIGFIIEQPRIKEDRLQNMDFSNPILMEKYKDELHKRGFALSENDPTTIYNDDYIIEDLHEDNIFIDEKGNFYFIDTVPSLNTSEDEFEGERQYGDNII